MRKKNPQVRYYSVTGSEPEIQKRIDDAFRILFDATLRRCVMEKEYPLGQAPDDSQAQASEDRLGI